VTGRGKVWLGSLALSGLVVLFFIAPFALATYIVAHPRWDDQFGNGIPSRAFHLLYDWIPALSESNPYRQLFTAHIRAQCIQHPDVCTEQTPTRP